MADDAETVEILIREAADADMEAIQDIYAHHVLEGLASFEETPPDVAELTRRRDAHLDGGYPYLVAEATGMNGGKVLGYAYAAAYRPRPAYLHTVENSVYVATGTQRQGIGGRLLEALIERCTEQGFRQMIAIIGDSGNAASIGLHARFGFDMIGVLPSVGFKFGRWVDQVIMRRPLGEGSESLPEPKKIGPCKLHGPSIGRKHPRIATSKNLRSGTGFSYVATPFINQTPYTVNNNFTLLNMSFLNRLFGFSPLF